MRSLKQSQSGYGVVGIFGAIVFFVFLTYVVIKVVSIYYDAFVIHKEVAHLATGSFSERTASEIKSYLKRQLDINGIESVTEDNIHVEYDPGQQAYMVHVIAEERARIVHKLFLLIQIDESTLVPKA